MSGFQQICCAVDFSEHSFAALRRAVELARRLESELTLVHVFPPGAEGSLARAERALARRSRSGDRKASATVDSLERRRPVQLRGFSRGQGRARG